MAEYIWRMEVERGERIAGKEKKQIGRVRLFIGDINGKTI